jgi:transcriptional regulator with XRE-family HTH domain
LLVIRPAGGRILGKTKFYGICEKTVTIVETISYEALLKAFEIVCRFDIYLTTREVHAMPTSFPNMLEANVKRRRLEVGRRLARARTDAGYPQEAVAEALNCYQADISRIEKGERTVDIVELENFAVLYEKSLEDFGTWKGQLDADRVAGNIDKLAEGTFKRRAARAKLKRKWRWKNYKRKRGG